MLNAAQQPEDMRKRVVEGKRISESQEQLSTPKGIPGIEVSQAKPQGLPPIDWKAQELAPHEPLPLKHPDPRSWRDHHPLPKADVVVMTWTADEWAALHYVFGNGPTPLGVKKKDYAWRNDWRPYRRDFWQVYQTLYLRRLISGSRNTSLGAPALDREVMGWGSYRLVTVNDKKVLLFKSALHINQDGEGLPLVPLCRQIIEDCKPKLILSVGTSGGVDPRDGLGDTVVTNSARFRLAQEFGSARFNDQTFMSTWVPPEGKIEVATRLLMPVPEATVSAPTAHYVDKTIAARPHQPAIKIVNSPILTTDFFEYGTTANKLHHQGCCVEMDDAVVAMVAKDKGVEFGFLRNISDPVITGHEDDFPRELQTAWAVVTYKTRGLYTSYNSAIATWAMIAA